MTDLAELKSLSEMIRRLEIAEEMAKAIEDYYHDMQYDSYKPNFKLIDSLHKWREAGKA